MQLGMIGLGRMGANMVRRLMRGGHQCAVFDLSPANVSQLAGEGAVGAASMEDFVKSLTKPRAAWVMVPSGAATESILDGCRRPDFGRFAGDVVGIVNNRPSRGRGKIEIPGFEFAPDRLGKLGNAGLQSCGRLFLKIFYPFRGEDRTAQVFVHCGPSLLSNGIAR